MTAPLLNRLPPPLRQCMNRAGATDGGEYKGPCPWCGGEDRFTISPAKGESGLWCCRQCERGGDGINLLRSDAGGGLTFAQACRALGLEDKTRSDPRRRAQARSAAAAAGRQPKRPHEPKRLDGPPGDAWQEKARAFEAECRRALWVDTAAARSAQAYLEERGLTERTIRAAGLGLNEQGRRPSRESWGLLPRDDKDDGGRVWLPRGIVIPWWDASGKRLWKVNIRRPDGDVERRGGPKYVQAAGKQAADGWTTNALYGASALHSGRPAVLVEGEFDALAIMQEARAGGGRAFGTGRSAAFGADAGAPLAAAVATGSTGGARRPRWIGKLAACRPVLLAFDAEKQSEGAVAYWRRVLPNARRHAPAGAKDAAAMLEGEADVRAWIRSGLAQKEAC